MNGQVSEGRQYYNWLCKPLKVEPQFLISKLSSKEQNYLLGRKVDSSYFLECAGLVDFLPLELDDANNGIGESEGAFVFRMDELAVVAEGSRNRASAALKTIEII